MEKETNLSLKLSPQEPLAVTILQHEENSVIELLYVSFRSKLGSTEAQKAATQVVEIIIGALR